MISVGLLFISLIPLLILVNLLKQAYRSGCRLRTAVIGSTIFHELVLVVFPIWYSVFTDFFLEQRMAIWVRPEDLLVVMIGEVLFTGMFGLGMILGRRVPPREVPVVLSPNYKYKEKVFLFVLVAVGTIIYLNQFLSPVESYEALTLHAEIKVADTWYGMIYEWIRGAFQFTSLVAACYLLLQSEKNPKLLRLVGSLPLVFLALTSLSAGVRGRITWIASLLVVIGFIKGTRKPIYVGVLLIIGILPIFSFLSGEFREIYYTELKGASRVESLRSLMQAVRSGEAADSEELIVNLASRAQGPRNSAVLYWLQEEGLGAGYKPLLSSVYAPIPRFLWAEKGVGGSVDGTSYGAAIFLVRKIGYNAPFYNMGPILASAHAYWEGGWIWLLLAGLITGLFWSAVLGWVDRSGRAIDIIISLTFSASLLIDGLLTALVPLYALVLSFWTAVLPTFIAYKLIVCMSFKKRLPKIMRTSSAQAAKWNYQSQ